MKKYLFIMQILYLLLSANTHAQSWLLAGNTGTAPANSFIGTKDNKALSLRTNNMERVRITQQGNVGIGINAPQQKLDVNGNINIGNSFSLYMDNHKALRIDSANGNTFLGVGAGDKGAGAGNTGTGFQALYEYKSGWYNTANGYQALMHNVSGYNNTATGALALYSNASGNENVAYGNHALFTNNTGSYNTANGYASLAFNTTGNGNTALGYYAAYYSQTGEDNVSLGKLALFYSNSGSYNTATGAEALYTNAANGNTATGYRALYSNTSGRENAALGFKALYANTTGNYNTALGRFALYNTPFSSNNTALGSNAGSFYQNGWNNTFVGAFSDAVYADIYNSSAIGNEARVAASNQVRIGNSYITSIGGSAGWSTISDGRVKKNIKENVPGLNFINKLKAVTYNLDLDATDRLMQRPSLTQNQERVQAPADAVARNAKQQVVYTGFVAQDVERAAKELHYDFSGVDAAKNDKDLYSLRYAEFVVPLVKAVQELSQQNGELKQRIEQLEAAISQDSPGEAFPATTKNVSLAGVSLSQNTPNPFHGSTTIRYVLPQQFSTAKIIVSGTSGQPVKEISLSGTGRGSVVIDAAAIAAGAYHYTLYINGKQVESKKMVLNK